MKKSFLIFGSSGQVGLYASSYFAQKDKYEVYSSLDDITNERDVFILIKDIKPDVILNCAAFTDVDMCEREVKLAMATNFGAVLNIINAARCLNKKPKIVHICSDYVYDGLSYKNRLYTENHPENPLSVYGVSKMLGTNELLIHYTNSIVIRTSRVFGEHPLKTNIILQLYKAITDKNAHMIYIQENILDSSPTYVPDLVRAIDNLLEKNVKGLYLFCNRNHCTLVELAEYVYKLLNTKKKFQMIGVTREKYMKMLKKGVLANRPTFSALSTRKYELLTNKRPRTWKSAVKSYLKKIELI